MNATFKIRASAIGQIMPNGKKPGELSKTAKTYCQMWAKELIYVRKKEVHSKYMSKGIEMEDDAIEYIAEKLNLGFVLKNVQFYENDFLTGTPDLVLRNEIIDIKCSFDCFTFPLFDNDLENMDYFYQLQGYMHLTGRKSARVVYVLMNTPEDIVEKEIRYTADEDPIRENEIRLYHNYSNVATKYRIKEFSVYYDPEVIEAIKKRVEECQEYINSL